LQDHIHDKWTWLLDHVYGYSLRGAYHLLTSADEPTNRNHIDNVWNIQVPLKVSLFGWRLLRNWIPTKDNLVRRRVITAANSLCAAGCGVPETAYHLFLGCETFSRVWYFV